jgi:hypothetical protein
MPPYSVWSGVWHSGWIWDDANDALWLSGVFDSAGAVGESNKYCEQIFYYKNGSVHPVGGLSGFIERDYANYLSLYNRPRAFTFTLWQNAVIVCGAFTTAGGELIGTNIAQYDYNTGWCSIGYGADAVIFSAQVYNNNGYKDLLVVGDFTSIDGVATNHIAGKYSEEHLATLKPNISYTAIADMPATLYPPTLTAQVESPAGRSVTSYLRFKKGINGDTVSVLLNKTDSLLTNFNPYWTYTRTAAFTGTVVTGDTIHYWGYAVDNLGNDSTSAMDSYVIIFLDYPATPDYIFDYKDLQDSIAVGDSVSNWTNQQDTTTLRGTIGRRPVMTATGLRFDINDVLTCNMIHALAGDSMTVIIYMQMDTNYSAAQWIFNFAEGSPNVFYFVSKLVNTAIPNKIGISYTSTATTTHRTYLTTLGNPHNTYRVWAFTTDSTNRQGLTINDVEGVNQGAAFSTGLSVFGFSIGDVNNTGGMNNAIIKRIIIYKRKASAAELTTAKLAAEARG